MPPKTDPYATATHRRIDLLLLILTTIIALAFYWRNTSKPNIVNPPAVPAAQEQM